MNTYQHSNRVRFIELDYRQGNDSNRIGGKAPINIVPTNKDSHYLMTVILEGDIYISIFLSQDSYYFIGNDRKVHSEGSEAVEVILHEKLVRREDDNFVSVLSPHALELSQEAEDMDEEHGEVTRPSSRNKIGGDAYLINWQKSLIDSVSSLKEQDFQQFLQIDVSMLGNVHRNLFIEGTWPFGDGILHLFVRPSTDSIEWRCFWEN